MKSLYFENSIARVAALQLASVFTKKAAFAPFAPVQYGDIDEPQVPGPNWLKVKNINCGLCGTDIHFLFMNMDPKCFPAALPGIKRKHLGHELVGEVIETGSGVEDLAPGDRISLRIDWPSCFQMEIDPPCRQCGSGNYMLCENLGTKDPYIVDNGGGFSPFMVIHKTQAYKIPTEINDEHAVLIEPTSCAVHTVMKRKPEKDEQVLVIGAGTIGLLTLAVTRDFCPEANIACIVRYPFQAEIAKKLGADAVLTDNDHVYQDLGSLTKGKYFKGFFGNEILLGGFDVIYDTVGNDRTVRNALRWAKGGGNVILSGINFKPGKIDYSTVWNQEVNFTGINCHATESGGQTSFDMAVKFLLETDLPVHEIITHQFSMEDYQKAVETFMSKKETQAIKIVLNH